ncbi:MAG: hypothetical protein AAF282_05790 [Cyanobacteria bacterium P01_A01_bin.15]
MHNHHQNEVKAVAYCASMAESEQQRDQDMLLSILIGLSAVAVVGLRYLF